MNGYNIVDIFKLPVIHTAIAEYLFTILYILPLKRRFSIRKTILICLLILPALLAVNLLREDASNAVWMLCMFTGMTLMAIMLYSTCNVNIPEALYHWSRAFIVAEFAASLEWQLTYYLLQAVTLKSAAERTLCEYTVLAIIYALTFLLLDYTQKKEQSVKTHFHISWKESAGALSIAMVAFTFSNFSFAFRDSAYTESLGVGSLYVRTLVDLAGVILLFANNSQRHEINLAYELEAINNLMNRQYEQYRQHRKNDEALHRLYHDLKHQIAFIRAETDSAKREAYLAEMDDAIRRHEAATDTGDSVLDTLLTSKNLTCIEHQITMTCFADATHMDFLDAMDVCSIFGNALDNAIEYEERIEDKSKRLIKVTVFERNHFLMIMIENYCEESIDLEEDRLKTTKPDKQMHGYGLRSIRNAVKKYGGHLTLKHEDDWVRLSILIPIE